MSHWNYRVVRCGETLKVFDVYYDDAGRPNGRHRDPSFVYGESMEDLREQLSMIEAALDLPILDDNDLGSNA